MTVIIDILKSIENVQNAWFREVFIKTETYVSNHFKRNVLSSFPFGDRRTDAKSGF